MCGRFTYKLTWEELVRLYRLTLDQPARNTQARYNVCPTDPVDTSTAWPSRCACRRSDQCDNRRVEQARVARSDSSRLGGEVGKIGLVCLVAKQAFVGRLLSDLWFQGLSGFPLGDSVRDFLCAGDDVLRARGGALSFCSRRVRLMRHQIVLAVLGRYSALGANVVSPFRSS
jgi:hypothetical protein